MDNLLSSGALLPLWILGAPLLAGIASLFTTPGASRSEHDVRMPQRAA